MSSESLMCLVYGIKLSQVIIVVLSDQHWFKWSDIHGDQGTLTILQNGLTAAIHDGAGKFLKDLASLK